jgi:dimethylsulfoniopropionate demethylase
MTRVFGAQVKDIGFFHIRPLVFQGVEMQVSRSGWSKQGGFEIYVNQAAIAGPLWDELFKQGQDLQVKAGCPNLIERIESGLLSFGNDMGYDTTPLEVGLDAYVDLQDDIDSLSLPALRQHKPKKKLMGLIMDASVKVINNDLHMDDQYVGEIRSMAYSPRYKKQLAFVLCHLHALGNQRHVSVTTDTGYSIAQLCDFPFDFKSLNLSA